MCEWHWFIRMGTLQCLQSYLLLHSILFFLLHHQHPVTSEPASIRQQHEFDHSVNRFKLNLQKTLEDTRVRGQRRNSAYTIRLDGSQGFEEEKLTVRDLQQQSTSGSYATDLTGITAWASIEGSNAFYLAWGLSNGGLRIAQFNGPFGQTVIRQRFQDIRFVGFTPFKLRYFVEQRFIWLVVAYSDPRNPEALNSIAVYKVNGTIFVPKQVIRAQNAEIDLIQDRNAVYLVIGESSKIRMFVWSSTQFDEVASRSMRGVTSVKILRISSDIYVATAQVDPETPFKSQLLLYKPLEKKTGELKSHQFLETKYKYEKVNSFTTGGNVYLVYIGSESATIFSWVDKGFLEFQTLENSLSSIDVFPIRLIDGEILLTLLFQDRLSFYTQSSNSTFVEVYRKDFAKEIQLKSIHLAAYANKHLYAFIALQQQPTLQPISPVWKIRLVPYLQAPSSAQEDILGTCLSQLKTDVMARDTRLKELSTISHRVWIKNRPQEIRAPVVVEGNVVVKGISRIPNMRIISSSNLTIVPQITSSQVKARLFELDRMTKHLQVDMSRMARKDRSNLIAGKVNFVKPLTGERIRIGRIPNPFVMINGLAFKDLQDNVLRTDQDQLISGKWTFASGLKADKMFVSGRVNGIRMNDILLKHSNTTQVVTGKIVFRNLTIESNTNLPPSGTINGVYLSDIVTKTSPHPQVVHGIKRFVHVDVVNNVNVRGLTNGKDLAGIARKSVKLNSPVPQVLRGKIILDAESTDIESLQANGLINDVVNMTHLKSFAVLKSKPGQVITGRKTFHSVVSVSGNMDVSGRINGIDFSRDLVTINRPQEIVTPLIFKAPVKFLGSVDPVTVNGIDFSAEVVLRNSPVAQVITARKGFMKGITVKGDITMSQFSTIDDVDPSELQRNVMSRNNITLHGPLVFEEIRVRGNVVAQKGVNGFMIGDLPNTVWLKSANQTIRRPVTFLSPIIADRVTARTVNGLRLPQDFVLRSSPVEQVVTGRKIFLDDVSLPYVGLTTNPGVKLNGVDVNQFNHDMVRNTETAGLDPIGALTTFSEIRVKGNIYASKINGLDLKKDVMIKNLSQTVLSPVIFVSPLTEVQKRLYVQGNINVKELTNGVKLKDWANDVVQIRNSSRVITNKKFVSLNADSISAEGTINSIDLNDFRRRVVTLDSSHLITAPKTMGKVSFENQLTVERLNGLNITEHAKLVVKRDQTTTVTGTKTILGRLVVIGRDLRVNGLINGISIGQLVQDSFSKTRNNFVRSNFTFVSTVRMPELGVKVINGIPLDDLIYLTDNSTVVSDVVFENDIKVEGQLVAEKGIINGCDLRRLSAEAIPLDAASVVVGGRKRFSRLEVGKHLNVTGNVNGIDIPSLASQVVTLDSPHTIAGPVRFQGPVTVDNLILLANISGLDLNFIMRDAVYKSRPQTINGRTIFMHDLTVNGPALFARDMFVKGLVNGVNLTLLNQTLVSRYAYQSIDGIKTFASPQGIVFKKDITVKGLMGSGVNMLKIPEDLVLLSENAIIPSDVIFRRGAQVMGNLTVKGLVDGIYLPEFASRPVTLHQFQVTGGDMVFKDIVTIDSLTVRKTINGIPVGDIVTRTGNHVLQGEYQITGGLHASRHLILPPGALVNGVSLEEIHSRAVDSRVGGRVTGTIYFSSASELGLQGLNPGLLNGMSVRGLVSDFANYSTTVNRKVDEFRSKMGEHEVKLRSQLQRIDWLPTKLSHFEIVYEFSQDTIGANVKIKKFVPVPNRLHVTYVNNSDIPYQSSDRLIYWRERGHYVNDESCSVLGSLMIQKSKNEYREHGLPVDGTRPMFAIHGLRFVQPFFLWLNDSDCSAGPQVLSSAPIDIVNNQLRLSAIFAFTPISSSFIVDARPFSHLSEDYLIVGFGNRIRPIKAGTVVFRFDQKSNLWVMHQQIQTFAVTAMDLITISGRVPKETTVQLVLANRLTIAGTPSPSQIYTWNGPKRLFEPSQQIKTWSPSAVQFIGASFDPLNVQSFLVVANEKSTLYGGECDLVTNEHFSDSFSSYFNQHVNIYSFVQHNNHWEMIQSLNMQGVTSIDHIHLPPDGLILLTGSRTLGKTSVHLMRGVNLFQEIQSFETPSVTSIKSFWTSDGELFVAVGSDDAGQSKLLRAVLSGPLPRLRNSSPFTQS